MFKFWCNKYQKIFNRVFNNYNVDTKLSNIIEDLILRQNISGIGMWGGKLRLQTYQHAIQIGERYNNGVIFDRHDNTKIFEWKNKLPSKEVINKIKKIKETGLFYD